MNEDKSRQRLGRGLASLIGSGTGGAPRSFSAYGNAAAQAEVASEPIPAERFVAIDALAPNPNNPRRRFDAADLDDLTASLRQHGVVQPLLVRPDPDRPGSFEIVAGERRWRAARKAGLTEVPVVLRDIGDRQSLEIAIIENVQRADLDAIEEALGYQKLVDEHGYTQADLAEVLGKSRSHVANTLRLLKLPETVQARVSNGELSPGAARTLVTAEDPEALAREIVERGLTVRQAEDLARAPGDTAAYLETAAKARPRSGRGRDGEDRRSGDTASPDDTRTEARAPKDADAMELERLLSNVLGLPVDIEVKGESGSIRIDYADMDQLDALCRRLQQGAERHEGPRIRSL